MFSSATSVIARAAAFAVPEFLNTLLAKNLVAKRANTFFLALPSKPIGFVIASGTAASKAPDTEPYANAASATNLEASSSLIPCSLALS